MDGDIFKRIPHVFRSEQLMESKNLLHLIHQYAGADLFILDERENNQHRTSFSFSSKNSCWLTGRLQRPHPTDSFFPMNSEFALQINSFEVLVLHQAA